MKREKRKKILHALFAILSLLLFSCSSMTVYTNTGELRDTINTLQPRVIELSNIKIKPQPNGFTCGITTVTVVSNYYNNTDYEANDLIEKYRVNTSKGKTDNDMKKWLQSELPGKNIVYESNGTNEEMIGNIHTSLSNGNPVVIAFGSPNPYNEPYYDSHFSIVCGINLDNETISIANSYGYMEEISLVDFLNRMSFAEVDKYPSFLRLAIKMNRMGRNRYFEIK